MNVPYEQTRQYGIVSTERDVGDIQRVTGIVEEAEARAPSTDVVGRYILTGRIFDHLRQLRRAAGERPAARRRDRLANREEAVLAYSSGRAPTTAARSWVTCRKATVELALKHPEVPRSCRLPGRPLQPSTVGIRRMA